MEQGAMVPGGDATWLARVLPKILEEVAKQDAGDPSAYPLTRNGIRKAITDAGDELQEMLDEWRAARCKCAMPGCHHANWMWVRAEAVDVIAILLRMMRGEPVDVGATESLDDPQMAQTSTGGPEGSHFSEAHPAKGKS